MSRLFQYLLGHTGRTQITTNRTLASAADAFEIQSNDSTLAQNTGYTEPYEKPLNGPKSGYTHNAFISYSRKDQGFARKLEKALEDYKPPKDLPVPHRQLDIFRDEADVTGVEYHQAISKHLKESAKLIVICSPFAHQSTYVSEEIPTFAALNGSGNIIPVLLSGIPNNEARTASCQDRVAFPDVLCELMEMPLAVNYVDFDHKRDHVAKGRFESSWYTTLANLYEISRSEVEQRDKRRQARSRRTRIGIVAAIILSLSIALIVTVQQREVAIRERNLAVSRELATSALSQLPIDPALGGLLAIESARAAPTDQADDALRAFLREPHLRNEFSGHTGAIRLVAFNRDGTFIASSSSGDNTARVWDLNTGKPVAVLTAKSPIDAIGFSPDGTTVATGSLDGTAQIWSAQTGRPLVLLKGHVFLHQVLVDSCHPRVCIRLCCGSRHTTGNVDDQHKDNRKFRSSAHICSFSVRPSSTCSFLSPSLLTCFHHFVHVRRWPNLENVAVLQGRMLRHELYSMIHVPRL